MKRPADTWEGAIVRHRDTRKGRVLQDGIHRLTRSRLLLVHWDDDTVDSITADRVTMLAPPLHYRKVVPPTRATRREVLERTGPWWSGIIGLVSLLICAGLIVWALATGAL